MRYDDFDDYNSSRSSRRGSSSRSGGGRGGRDGRRERDYRDDFGYDRDFDRYDRYDDRYDDRGRRDYDRYDDRYDDRYGARRSYDDFDRADWERTAPNWEDRDAARRKPPQRSGRSSGAASGRGSSSRSGSGRAPSRSGGQGRGGSRGRSGGSGDRRRGSSGGRRPPKRRVNLVPIVLGLIVVVIAGLAVKHFVGGGSSGDYTIEFSSRNIVLGETATATITPAPDDATAVTWSSGDNTVVAVEGDGATCTLTAKSEGQATIVATIGDKTVSNTVVVSKYAKGVKEITVPNERIDVYSGETATITATVVMEEGLSPAKITWTSNDPSVAPVTDAGVVTGRDVGTAIIKGTAGDKTVEVIVTVKENPNVTPNDPSQDVGQPEEGTDQTGTGTTGGTGTNGTTGDAANTGTGSGDTTGTTGSGDGTGDAATSTPTE